jgi:hypothetical protein
VDSSRRVTVWSFRDWKSIVQAKGIPTSSVLAYLLPMLTEEASAGLGTSNRRQSQLLIRNPVVADVAE